MGERANPNLPDHVSNFHGEILLDVVDYFHPQDEPEIRFHVAETFIFDVRDFVAKAIALPI